MRKSQTEYKKISVQITSKQAKLGESNILNNLKNKHEILSVRVTLGQKNQIERLAGHSDKSLSEYIRDAVLSVPLDKIQIEFYQNIINDLNYLKEKTIQLEKQSVHLERYSHAIIRLLNVIGSEPRKSPKEFSDITTKYLRETKEKVKPNV